MPTKAAKGPQNGTKPTKRKIRRSDLRRACVDVIEQKCSTLYGGYFTIKGGKSERDQAADWLAGECANVLDRLGFKLEES